MFDYKKLEFDKVIEMVKKECVNEATKSELSQMNFYLDKEQLEQELNNVDEAYICLKRIGKIPLEGINNVNYALKMAKLGSILSIKDFIDIRNILQKARDNKLFSAKLTKYELVLPNYQKLVKDLFYDKYVYTMLKDNIVDNLIVDSASSELLSIRKQQKNLNLQINDVLKNIASKNKMLANTIITSRNGRYCVCVKAEYKNKFPGIVHDVSSSGETFFIEPKRVVELTNKESELLAKEAKEVERILAEYTNLVAEIAPQIAENYQIFIYLDKLFSKARFALKYNCQKQKIGDKINLYGARHVLLNQETVVKNNISFDNYKVVLITGPNTGGKTVTLKTLGLLVLMNQYGLLLPTDANSEIKMFDNVFCDIGDEQSIEQSLSTFSGHMTNIVRIINHLDDKSLVLLDELCSGTDPKEGANLAMAIIDEIISKNATCMATTHYSELKAYAYNHPDIINASTEFDINSLQPTYKLRIGIPGKSNAFAISKRLGLAENIIENARGNLSNNDVSVTNLITKLENKTKSLEEKIKEYDDLVAMENTKVITLEKKLDELKVQNYKDRENAKLEAKKIITEASKKADQIIKELQTYHHDKIKLHELHDIKNQLTKAQEALLPNHLVNDTNYEYQVGDTVKVSSYNNSVAKIIKKLPEQNYQLQMGIIQVKVNRKYLELVKNKEKKTVKSQIKYQKNINVKLSLDLRGLRYEEAKERLDKYIDDLVVANIKQATIIHGYGTLAIQKMVWDYLKNSKYIEDYDFASGNNGGHGATEIKLK